MHSAFKTSTYNSVDTHTSIKINKLKHMNMAAGVVLTLLRDAVHHRAEHQDVRAAVGAAPQPAVTAQTCRTNRRPHTDTLAGSFVLTQSAWLILSLTHMQTVYDKKHIC